MLPVLSPQSPKRQKKRKIPDFFNHFSPALDVELKLALYNIQQQKLREADMLKILIAEDDLELRQLFAHVLVKNGYSVRGVSNG